MYFWSVKTLIFLFDSALFDQTIRESQTFLCDCHCLSKALKNTSPFI